MERELCKTIISVRQMMESGRSLKTADDLLQKAPADFKNILEVDNVIKVADPIANAIVLAGSLVENRYRKLYDLSGI